MSDRPWWLLLAALGGCVPELKDLAARESALVVPDTFPQPDGAPSAAANTWTAYFQDPALVALVDEAVAHNQELGILLQEARGSDAEFVARRGEYLPRVGVTAGAGLERVGRFTSQGASDADDEIEPGRTVPEDLGDLHAGLEASWELDVWGRLRNESRAAQLRYFASVEGRNFAVTGVVAEVAEAWYELLALDAELRVIDDNIQVLTTALEIVRLEKDAARVTELAVQRFEADLLKSRAHRTVVVRELAATENRLNARCGRFPQPIPREPGAFDRAPLPAVGAGHPADLLANRPDIRRAELALAASRLDVKAARAGFYPSLGLDAGVGLSAFSAATLPSPESLAFELAGGVFAPLLNRADRKGAWLAANAEQTKAALEWELAVVSAVAEVSTLRARIENLDESARIQADQVGTLQEAVDTSTTLFRNARADWLEVLSTRREALESELDLVETRQQQLSARVALYRALGGGWRDLPDSTPRTRGAAPRPQE
jgi:multidrug efflux system outer membrane protein